MIRKNQGIYLLVGISFVSNLLYLFASTDTLKEILREIDNKLTEEELDGIIEEVDEDGSGTLDFDGIDIDIKMKMF